LRWWDSIGGWVEMAGGMDVHKNVHIENWGTARENLEKTFRFTRRNITLALIFGVAAPFLTYQGVSGEFVSVLSFGVCGMGDGLVEDTLRFVVEAELGLNLGLL
jgi:hypothetical protein